MEISERADAPGAPSPAAVVRAKNISRHERLYSLVTAGVGLTLGAGTTLLVREGIVPLATEPLTALTCLWEVLVYIVLFDGYFYALHRLLHTRTLYQRVHSVHHRSTAPTLMTALAFHPIEALAIMGFMPVAMYLLPIHLASLVIVSCFLSGSIALAHCGYEVFPRWIHRVPVLNWYVTPRVHDEHHKRRNCNYAATLSIFDRAFGTLRTDDFAGG